LPNFSASLLIDNNNFDILNDAQMPMLKKCGNSARKRQITAVSRVVPKMAALVRFNLLTKPQIGK